MRSTTRLMRVLLVHNEGSGTTALTPSELVQAFEQAGHSTIYWSTHYKNWRAALNTTADAVVIVGGDGTVRKTALAMAEHSGPRPPLTIVPSGVANNISRALDIHGTVQEVAA